MYDRIRALRKDKYPTQTLAVLAKFHRTSIDYLLNLTDKIKADPEKK